MGSLELLPAESARLKAAADATAGVDGMQVNVCVGYGGRQELTDAMRSLLLEKAGEGYDLADVASTLEVDHIAEHLYTKGQPDPDLVIRTSGSSGSPASCCGRASTPSSTSATSVAGVPSVDLLRAMRSYASRERRFGT